MNTKSAPFLSVVVIGRNEGDRLSKCLESVKQMNFPQEKTELIYVDSSSVDDSVQRAESLGAKVIQVDSSHHTAALARNLGWKVAEGEFVLFLDGDTLLDRDFVAASLPKFSHPDLGIIFGNRKEMCPKKSVYNRVLDLDWSMRMGYTDMCGGDAIIRRTVLEQVNGYNSSLIAGEEPEMCNRMQEKGVLILHLNTTMTLHDLNMTSFSAYWRRCFRTGYTYASISHLTRSRPKVLWRKNSFHNFLKGSLLLFLFIGSLSVLKVSFIPMTLFFGILGLFVLRTAIKARSKTKDLLTCLLYGVHAHFQHIPMLFGQLTFWVDKWKNKARTLIEYK